MTSIPRSRARPVYIYIYIPYYNSDDKKDTTEEKKKKETGQRVVISNTTPKVNQERISSIHRSKSSTPPPRVEDVAAAGTPPNPAPTFTAEVFDPPHIDALAFSFSKSLMLFPVARESPPPVTGLDDEDGLLPPSDKLHKSSKLLLLLLALASVGAEAVVVTGALPPNWVLRRADDGFVGDMTLNAGRGVADR